MSTQQQNWPKVGPDLSWARFPGWTILFDPPDGGDFDAEVGDAGRTSLTDATKQMAGKLAAAKLSTVAVLPSSTHHITLCDGVNPAMFARSKRRRHHRSLKAGTIDRFPRRLRASVSALLDAASATLEFEPYGAELRHTAIVLSLTPTPPSAADFADIRAARAVVLHELGGLLGLDLERPWRPHVTLGYLTDRGARASVIPVIDTIDGEAARLRSPIRVESAGVFQFTSMVSFRRLR